MRGKKPKIFRLRRALHRPSARHATRGSIAGPQPNIDLPSQKENSHSCTEPLILTLARPDPEHFIRGAMISGVGVQVGREFCKRSEPLRL